MIARRTLAVVIAAWALITWGGRVGLLVGGEGVWAWVRIAGSLVVAAAATHALWRSTTALRANIAVYTGFTFVVWSMSAVSVLSDPSSTAAFKAVHVVLATVSIVIAVVAWNVAVRRSGPVSEHR